MRRHLTINARIVRAKPRRNYHAIRTGVSALGARLPGRTPKDIAIEALLELADPAAVVDHVRRHIEARKVKA